MSAHPVLPCLCRGQSQRRPAYRAMTSLTATDANTTMVGHKTSMSRTMAAVMYRLVTAAITISTLPSVGRRSDNTIPRGANMRSTCRSKKNDDQAAGWCSDTDAIIGMAALAYLTRRTQQSNHSTVGWNIEHETQLFVRWIHKRVDPCSEWGNPSTPPGQASRESNQHGDNRRASTAKHQGRGAGLHVTCNCTHDSNALHQEKNCEWELMRPRRPQNKRARGGGWGGHTNESTPPRHRTTQRCNATGRPRGCQHNAPCAPETAMAGVPPTARA